ncbi:MAG: RidA family protein [Acidobacteria bacterium]|nr:RidA family protein [Acidobacteriota bacterium]
MTPQPIDVPALPPNNTTYSQAVRMGGLIFVSGQLGVDPSTGRLAPGGIAGETRQAIANLRTVLEAAGSGLDRVARVNIFITRFDGLAAMNEVYAPAFPHRPAKTTVEVSRLDKGAMIEMEVIAAAPVE